MERARAELSSVETQVDEIIRRIVDAANEFERSGREDVAHELFEAERAMRTARRRLERAARDSGR